MTALLKLLNVFKSHVLSLLRYSCTVLISCSDELIQDMQVFKNILLRSIHITARADRDRHKILDVSDFLLKSCLEQVSRILNNPQHVLPVSLKSTTKSHYSFPFRIPLNHTEKFKMKALMITLRHLRSNGVPCTNPKCKSPTKLWKNLSNHLRGCLRNNPI